MGRREGGVDRSYSKAREDARTWEVEEKKEKKKKKEKKISNGRVKRCSGAMDQQTPSQDEKTKRRKQVQKDDKKQWVGPCKDCT